MNIDKDGYKLSTTNDLLNFWERQLQKKFGSDFYIKPEGVIDNIAASAAFMEMFLQEQIAFLAKQFDPETAEGIYQDALYARVGLTRLDEEETAFVKKVKGVAGYSGTANTIFIRSTSSGYEFTNTSDYTIADDGSAALSFECVTVGPITVNAKETFTIVDSPAEIIELLEEDASDISIGRDRESDSDFRVRFHSFKNQSAKGTRNANIDNLLPYVDNKEFLKILDKRTDNTMEAGTLKIIAKHNTTDEIFAKAIFNTVVDGLDLLGDTTVIVKDSEGQEVPISWKNADEIAMDITGIIKIRDGYYANTVITNVKQSILDYIKERVYGLESVIYATEFIIPMLEVDGVEAVTGVQVKKTSESAFADSVSLTKEEVPAFAAERITLNTSD